MNILIVGAGYVGLSNAMMISSIHNVKVIDINKEKINQLKKGDSPIADSQISKYLLRNKSNLTFDNKLPKELKSIETVLVATPTDFNDQTCCFDTSSIESVIKDLKKRNFKGLVAIRSTVPIGFTDQMNTKFKGMDIAFFPEFLREGKALKDNLYPSRIICGSKTKSAKKFLKVLTTCAKKKNIKTLTIHSSDAEAIKLFSNTYLSMRVSFFNELDSFAMLHKLNPKNIIDGVSLDPRIGNFYNNPSFGFGGYCLPKDTKQLSSNFDQVPNKLISSISKSNEIRKRFIVDQIVKTGNKNIGIYKLAMKSKSDNWRESSIIDIIKNLKKHKCAIRIFDPELGCSSFLGIEVENDLQSFLAFSDLVVTNRLDKKISNYNTYIFTRDIYNNG